MENIIKITVFALLFVGFGQQGHAQTSNLNGYFYGQDALKYSQQKVNGTARMQGMGGGYASLGADATNAYANPAGLGFYNRSEFSLSPTFSNSNAKSTYLGVSSSLPSSNVNIGQAAAVFHNNGTGTRRKSGTFAIGYTKITDFNSDLNYGGTNQVSSITDSFAERATSYGRTSTQLDGEYDPQINRAFSPAALYYQSFLINPTDNGGYQAAELSVPVEQDGIYTETGSVNQWNLSYGANFDDKTYVGASVGIRSLNYQSLGDHSESFPNAENLAGFDYFDDLTVRGAGVNLSIGAIIKAAPSLQFGANLTTPTAMALRETYREGIAIRPVPGRLETDNLQIETAPNDFNYRITSPLRGNFGTTVFLPKKLGFVSAEVEYVGYKNMNVKDPQDDRWSSDQKRAIQDVFRDVINIKGGGEVRFNNIHFRGGVNYLADPYKDANNDFNRSQTLLTLGTGYRNARFFADVAGIFSQATSAYTPYTTANPADFGSVSVNTNRNNFVISVGAFF